MTVSAPDKDAVPDPHGNASSAKAGDVFVEARFGFWDAVSIIVGIVVGTAIFKAPTLVFQNSTGPWQAIGLWVLGGGLSLCGAFCYAELATAFPRNGGDYEYLNRAYGDWMGFLFGWAQLTAILSGSIAAMAYAFGDYAVRLFSLQQASTVWLAAGAVVLISALNLLGVMVGKSAQNLLSMAKILGLMVVAIAGMLVASQQPAGVQTGTAGLMGPGIGLAMVFVLYAYGGWNDAAFVAAEVRQPKRNLPRALVAGIVGITFIYVAINIAYLATLGFDAARQSYAPAADVLQLAVGRWGAQLVSLLVMISALGAINGMTLTGSRIYATMGADHRVFAWLGKWNQRRLAPMNAIVSQGLVALVLILAVGTALGRATIDWLLAVARIKPIPWEAYFGGFETLVASTAPVFWTFFLLTGVSLVVLRFREAARPRPFPVPGYPVPVIIFCLTCAYMLYSSVDYAGWLSLIGIVPLATGIPLYFVGRPME